MVGGRPGVEVGVSEVGKDAAGAVRMRERPRACEPGAGVVAVAVRAGGAEADSVLEQEALVPMGEGCRVPLYAVVGAAPGSEVELARLAMNSVCSEVVDQRLDRAAGKWLAEEFGLVEDEFGRGRLLVV